MNHSPAPWETSKDAVPDWHVQVTVYDTEGNRVATVFQNEGNVALVKAAPELLVACKRLVAITRNPDAQQLKIAIAAIDKAEGRAL